MCRLYSTLMATTSSSTSRLKFSCSTGHTNSFFHRSHSAAHSQEASSSAASPHLPPQTPSWTPPSAMQAACTLAVTCRPQHGVSGPTWVPLLQELAAALRVWVAPDSKGQHPEQGVSLQRHQGCLPAHEVEIAHRPQCRAGCQAKAVVHPFPEGQYGWGPAVCQGCGVGGAPQHGLLQLMNCLVQACSRARDGRMYDHEPLQGTVHHFAWHTRGRWAGLGRDVAGSWWGSRKTSLGFSWGLAVVDQL